MIEIVNADHDMIRSVLTNLRAIDAREIRAAGTDTSQLPSVIMRHKVFCFCAYEADPVAVWGMVKRRDGVGAGFAFGTKRWPHAIIPMLRQIRGFVIPYLIVTGYHRVEAAALSERDDVRAFMNLIGAESEGRLRGYGVGGEDFVSYRWLANEHNLRGDVHRSAYLHAAH